MNFIVLCVDSSKNTAETAAGDNKAVRMAAVKSAPVPPEQQQEPTTTTDDNRRSSETENSVTAQTQSKFEFVDSVAAFHASSVKKARERLNLVSNLGPHRRALCARRDLAVRRALCKVDKVPTCFSLSDFNSG